MDICVHAQIHTNTFTYLHECVFACMFNKLQLKLKMSYSGIQKYIVRYNMMIMMQNLNLTLRRLIVKWSKYCSENVS